MSIDIDWSKAPEGATHWGKGLDGATPGWMRLDAGVCYWWPVDGAQCEKKWYPCTTPKNLDGEKYLPRPTPWSGEGLPPVGLDVEVVCPFKHPSLDAWHLQRVTIIAHDMVEDGEGGGDPVAVFKGLYSRDGQEVRYHSMIAGCFRPIRTPEQIAAEERDSAIVDMKSVFDSCSDELMPTSNKYLETLFAALYDAGYRKQVAP